MNYYFVYDLSDKQEYDTDTASPFDVDYNF